MCCALVCGLGPVLEPTPISFKERSMNARKIAARFVAFTFFLNQERQSVLLEQAGRYARRHWKKYLGYASEDLVDYFARTPNKRQKERAQLALVNW
jgi:hypothetical protein